MANETAISPADRPIRNPELYAERNTEDHIASPEEEALATDEPPHNASLTAVAAEALRTGLYPMSEDEKVPGQDELLQGGDPDVDPLQNLYSGEELPGGSMTTPDQNDVELAGKAAGISDEDAGELRSPEEMAERRDARRWEQETLSPKV